MLSLSELLFPLQQHWCFSGQSRQCLSLTLNSLYKSICDGHGGDLGTCEDTSVKKEELVAQCLHPGGVVMHNLSPLQAPQENVHGRKDKLLQIQTMFSVTLILLLWSDQRQKHDTQLQTASSPKMAWVSEIYLAHFHLPLNISWLSKTYHLSLEKGILSWTDFTWLPEEAYFRSLMAA